ncbi:MAG: hypothetical protein H6872_03140 [Methylobacteriaceae bacterium]|nr:hypothetical protein [Methylobacteriaceae bacterium]
MTNTKASHPNHISAPVLKRTTSAYRTLEEDREYHINAHRSFRELAQLIAFVQHVAAAETEEAHKLAPEGITRSQRFALKARADHALQKLREISGHTDALSAQSFAETAITELTAAAAIYLGWSDERVRRDAPGYS